MFNIIIDVLVIVRIVVNQWKVIRGNRDLMDNVRKNGQKPHLMYKPLPMSSDLVLVNKMVESHHKQDAKVRELRAYTQIEHKEVDMK